LFCQVFFGKPALSHNASRNSILDILYSVATCGNNNPEKPRYSQISPSFPISMSFAFFTRLGWVRIEISIFILLTSSSFSRENLGSSNAAALLAVIILGFEIGGKGHKHPGLGPPHECDAHRIVR
jgi:hypothetical protein